MANSTAIQQGWVQHFVNEYGSASSATGIKYYILDNEPSLWYSTHRDVHPNPANYQEMYNKIVAYASAIRAADPAAKIVGPEEWSWWAMYFSGFDQANGKRGKLGLQHAQANLLLSLAPPAAVRL